MRYTKMNRLFKARELLTIILLLFSTVIIAQTKTITGTVVDDKGESLIGASIFVKGTSNGTITDMDGNFSIDASAQDDLVVKFTGYLERTIRVGAQTHINVAMVEDTQLLDEVVVVGYGVRKKSDVTGAIAQIGDKEMNAMPTENAMQAMQGKLAGVDITSNERPGELGNILIRGQRSLGVNTSGNISPGASNAPLYVVDGIILQALGSETPSGSRTTIGIENLNPRDIESINVLKDASATAIYGSRGANGVVIVTTKRGKTGKLSLNYSGTLSIENMHDRTHMMNSAEWIDFSRAAKIYAGTYNGSSTISYDNDYAVYGKDPYAWANFAKGWANGIWDGSLVDTYDWTAAGLQTAYTNEHTLSASGGTDKVQAYASFGYLHQEGTQPGQGYQRYTAKTTVDLQATDWMKIGANMNVTWGDQDYGYNFRRSTTGASNLYFALQGMLPYAVPYTPEGDYIRNPGGDVNIINPIREVNICVNNRQSLRAMGSFYAELNAGKILKVLDGLRYRFQFGPDFRNWRNGIADAAESINGDGNNIAQYNTQSRRSWTLDNLIYYDKTFGKHNIGITLLQSASALRIETENMTSFVNSFKELWYNIGSNSNIRTYSTDLTEEQMLSYMIRLNYGLNDRYLLTVSNRWDAASQLASGNKWSPFPSVALAWRMEQESFLDNVSWIQQLKLRLGYGRSGNSAVDPYGTSGAVSPTFYHFGAATMTGMIASDPGAGNPVVMANPSLGWEKTNQLNIGLDFSLVKSRINGSIDIYKSWTSDLLMKKTIPSTTGYTSTWANVGKTENKGIDITLNTVNIKTRNFTWTSDLTFSASRNHITELSNGKVDDVANGWFIGYSIDANYDYVYDGIWKTSEADEAAKYGRVPGEIKLKDISGPDGVPDGKIDANYDRQVIGKRSPDWVAGFVNTFTYRNWELSCFLYGRFGAKLNNIGVETLSGRFAQREVDYWIADVNENAEYYAPGVGGENGDTYKSAMGYRDGSFIKLRNVSLGYNFSNQSLKKVNIGNLKLYAQLMNPCLLYSKIKFIDPDLGGSTYNSSVVFGINIGF